MLDSDEMYGIHLMQSLLNFLDCGVQSLLADHGTMEHLSNTDLFWGFFYLGLVTNAILFTFQVTVTLNFDLVTPRLVNVI